MKMSQRYADHEAALRLTEGPTHPTDGFPPSLMQTEAPAWLTLVAIALFVGAIAVWFRIAEHAIHAGRFGWPL